MSGSPAVEGYDIYYNAAYFFIPAFNFPANTVIVENMYKLGKDRQARDTIETRTGLDTKWWWLYELYGLILTKQK